MTSYEVTSDGAFVGYYDLADTSRIGIVTDGKTIGFTREAKDRHTGSYQQTGETLYVHVNDKNDMLSRVDRYISRHKRDAELRASMPRWSDVKAKPIPRQYKEVHGYLQDDNGEVHFYKLKPMGGVPYLIGTNERGETYSFEANAIRNRKRFKATNIVK